MTDDPPIVIKTSRGAALLGIAVCLGLIALFATLAPSGAKGIDYGVIAIAGLWALIFVLWLVRPSTLTATPEGLTWFNGLLSRHWSWHEIGNFRASYGLAIGCDLWDSRSPLRALRSGNKTMTGSHGALLGGWEGGSAHAADVLNAARARWLV